MSVSRSVNLTKDTWVIQRIGSSTGYGNGTTPKISIGPVASATDATILYKGRGLYSVSAANMNTLLNALGSLSVATADFRVASAECGTRGTAQKIYLEEITGDFGTNTTTSNCQISTSGGPTAVWPGPTPTTVNRALLTTSGLSTGDTISFNILNLLRARLAANNFGVFRFRLIASNGSGGYDEANLARTVALYGVSSGPGSTVPSLSITGEIASSNVSATPTTAQGTGVANTPASVGSGIGVSKLSVDGEFGIISMRQASDVKYASLTSVLTEDTEQVLTFSADKLPTSGFAIIRLLGRYVDKNNHYRCDVRISPTGAVLLKLVKRVAGVLTTLASADAGLTLAPGSSYFLDFLTKGTAPCTLSVRLWRSGTSQPDWQVNITDTAGALQVNSTLGIGSELVTVPNVPITFSIDDYSVVAS